MLFFAKARYTQTECLDKYAAERSKKDLILLKGAIKILAIRGIFDLVSWFSLFLENRLARNQPLLLIPIGNLQEAYSCIR